MGELDSPDHSDFVKGIGLPECAVVETQLGTSLATFLPHASKHHDMLRVESLFGSTAERRRQLHTQLSPSINQALIILREVQTQDEATLRFKILTSA
jgi:hypothetical protein